MVTIILYLYTLIYVYYEAHKSLFKRHVELNIYHLKWIQLISFQWKLQESSALMDTKLKCVFELPANQATHATSVVSTVLLV